MFFSQLVKNLNRNSFSSGGGRNLDVDENIINNKKNPNQNESFQSIFRVGNCKLSHRLVGEHDVVMVQFLNYLTFCCATTNEAGFPFTHSLSHTH